MKKQFGKTYHKSKKTYHKSKSYHKKSHNHYYKKEKDIKVIIEKRYGILIGIIMVTMLILFAALFYVQIMKNEHYRNQVTVLTQNVIEGPTAPRGRIYDRHHRLIVDNTPTKVIYYKKKPNITTKEEIEIAYKVAEMIEVNFSSIDENDMRAFWVKSNPEEARNRIKDSEWKLYEERKISNDEINRYKKMRVTEEELNAYKDIDKEAMRIYFLMNEGYSYAEKTIKKEGITDEEYALISSNIHLLNGINTRLDWDRTYPYGSTFRSILGSVSSSDSGIPYELKDHYLEKGYLLNDRVGTSNLEYQYDDYLRGEKNQYEVLASGEYHLIKEGHRGNDLVLSIDIELQRAIEDIIVANLKEAKKEPNTEYYNRAFVIISDPNTGEILAMAGKQIVKNSSGNYDVYDFTPGITTSPVTVGSVIKGASHIVGYNTGALKFGELRYDTCIKIAATPEKCSFQYLGLLDDLTALKYSSNTYQFNTAIRVGKGHYAYDMPLLVDESAFDIYRNTFAEFGLGVETGIDLHIESLGYKGSERIAGLLLDFSIGQYDTYTPIQLSQYINTFANGGKRIAPHLLKSVYSYEGEKLSNLLLEVEPKVLNTVNTKPEYLNRVKKGFQMVLESGGTGDNFIYSQYKPAGKTGTSQSFIDTDLDGMIDKETISSTFAAYAPYDKPKVSFVVVSPDVSHYDNGSSYMSLVNMRISQQVSKKFFEIYK